MRLTPDMLAIVIATGAELAIAIAGFAYIATLLGTAPAEKMLDESVAAILRSCSVEEIRRAMDNEIRGHSVDEIQRAMDDIMRSTSVEEMQRAMDLVRSECSCL